MKSKKLITRNQKVCVFLTVDQYARAKSAALSEELSLTELARTALVEKLNQLGFSRPKHPVEHAHAG
jgi:hypothetical protein